MSEIFIITGAGIGGLATALALQQKGLVAEIYERDSDFNSRRQGYSLTIQRNGYNALDKLGLATKVKHMATDSFIERTALLNHLGQSLQTSKKQKKKTNNKKFSNFAVPRQALRECMMNELLPDTIHWNKNAIKYEERDNMVQVHFSDGTFKVCSALIGCDGVRSSIRKQMLGDDLNYLGVWAINGIAPHENHPFLLNKTFQTLDGRSRLFVKPFSSNKCMWQLTFKLDRDQALDQSDMQTLLERAKQTTIEWHDPIPQLLTNTHPDDIRAGPIFDRDPLDSIAKKEASLVTMLGDAVHPMSPFKGQGANQALCDAVSLVNFITTVRPLDAAFSQFEHEMLQRSRRYVLDSRRAVQFLHTESVLDKEEMTAYLSNK
jgi:salicylate hydroxylase